MGEDIIGRQELTADRILEVLQAAYLDAELDGDGDVRVSGAYKFFLIKPKEGMIHFLAIFGSKPESSRASKLEFVNRYNDQYKLVRAALNEHDDFIFDYYLAAQGGLPGRTLVESIRRFDGILEELGTVDTERVVA